MSTHPFDDLPVRNPPRSKRELDGWVAKTARTIGFTDGRLGWILASSIAVGVLQRATYVDEGPRFLLKGGAYLELRLGLQARATKDVDTLFRGTFDDFVDVLDSCLTSWGPLVVSRTEIEIIDDVPRVIKPRRFFMVLSVNGKTWRKVKIEVSADEAGVGRSFDNSPTASLAHFGLPSPGALAGIAVDDQVAQKVHACTDPNVPPGSVNRRARDVVDLLLLRDAFYPGNSELPALRLACVALFESRAAECPLFGLPPRTWPPVVVAHANWVADFARACSEADVDRDLDDSLRQVNGWIQDIDAAR